MEKSDKELKNRLKAAESTMSQLRKHLQKICDSEQNISWLPTEIVLARWVKEAIDNYFLKWGSK